MLIFSIWTCLRGRSTETALSFYQIEHFQKLSNTLKISKSLNFLEKVKGEEYYEYDEEYEEGSSESSSDISSENKSENNSAKLKELLMEHRSLEPSDDPGLSTQPSEEQEMNFTKEPDSKSAKLLEKSTKQQTIKTIQSSEMRSAGNVINCQNFIILIAFLKLVQIWIFNEKIIKFWNSIHFFLNKYVNIKTPFLLH